MREALAPLSFLEARIAAAFDLPPEDAIGYFRSKGLQPSFSYADMTAEAQQHAFTVAKMMDLDLLAQVRGSLDDALANGVTFRDWADQLMPTLQAAGWWGRQDVIDPVTGATVNARLGTPSRLETIFRVNMQTAYAAGQWRQIEDQADIAPYLMYDAVDDFRTRPLHRLWDRKLLPVTHTWWHSHYPPNGFNCRCGVIQLSAEEAEALGLSLDQKAPADGSYQWKNPRTGAFENVPEGIDPGFGTNAGRSYLDGLQKLLSEKVGQLPASMRTAARQSIENAENSAPVPTFTPEQANTAIREAFGPEAATTPVPRIVGRDELDGVPFEHRRAITVYTGDYYEDVNPFLRAGNAPSEIRRYADLLNEALHLSPKYAGPVARAIELLDAALEQFLSDHRMALLDGAFVVHSGFISTTQGDEAAFRGNVILHIDSARGVDVSSVSQHPHENEVLMQHGTRFRVLDIQQRDGRWHIHLEEWDA